MILCNSTPLIQKRNTENFQSSPARISSYILKVMTVAAAVIVVISLLAITGHRLPYSPLAFLPLKIAKILLTTHVAIAGGSLVGLIVLYDYQKSSKLILPVPKVIEKSVPTSSFNVALSLLSQIKTAFENELKSETFLSIEKTLSKGTIGFKNPLELQAFHYHLAKITDQVLLKEQFKEVWEKFLKAINQAPYTLPNNSGPFGTQIFLKRTLDCTSHMTVIKGEKIEIEIEELTKTTIKEDSLAINNILLDSFEIVPSQFAMVLEFFLSDPSQHFFVSRDKKSQEIIGMVVVQEKPNNTLFLHTLGRRAHYAKINLIENFKNHFEKTFNKDAYTEIGCNVLKTNLVAYNLYLKFGFKVKEERQSEDGRKEFYMIYQP